MSRTLAGIGLGREVVAAFREVIGVVGKAIDSRAESRRLDNDALRERVDTLERKLEECQDHVGQIRRAGRIAAAAAAVEAAKKPEQD